MILCDLEMGINSKANLERGAGGKSKREVKDTMAERLLQDDSARERYP